MSNSTAIGDVTKSLSDLLIREQTSPDLLERFEVSMLSPADEIIDDKKKINLYLFRIEENPFARNQDWQPVGSDILRKTPLSLNLFYVVTPYAKTQEDGHRVLGEAMRILYDNAIIEPLLLQEPLRNTAEALKLDLCSFNLEDLTRIWNAFNKPYQLSVCYQVRIVFIDSNIERSITRVIEKANEFEGV
ncbi:MAG TPA: DUF4255 domain-containing protein [Blastocatellia bacterium]|nr:DUF4255 domain-containing protein [Blastocatellia bacterium]